MRVRVWILTVSFGILFAIIANLSWLTAVGTTAPWFGTSVSLQTYGVSVVVASLVAIALVVIASNRSNRLDLRMLALDGRIALLRATPVGGNPSRAPADLADNFDLGPDLDEEVEELRFDGVAAMIGLGKQGHDTLLELPGPRTPAADRRRTDVLRELVRERVAAREMRSSLWRMVAGPVFVATLFVAVASVMIPGAEGFAAANFHLNTALVLFLSYGIAPLVAWALIAMAAFGSEALPPRA